jgi:hypothetical protein
MLPVVKFSDEKFREQADKVLADKVSAGETITSLDFKLALRAAVPGVYVVQEDVSKYLKKKFADGDLPGYSRTFNSGHFEYVLASAALGLATVPDPTPDPDPVQSQAQSTCPNCLGTGVDPDPNASILTNCSVCGGAGTVK